jgi:pimeloyl-ACP methyl ester carboxylesterase
MVDFRDAVADLALKVGRSSTALIPDCGHLAPMEAPAEFRRLVLTPLA